MGRNLLRTIAILAVAVGAASAAVPKIILPSAPAAGAAGLSLGVLASPAVLESHVFSLNEWQHLTFAVELPHDRGLGTPTIDGRAAEESRLEFKHTVRALSVADSGARYFRHDYSWLAIGATPEGGHSVSFADGAPAFSVAVRRLDRSKPDVAQALREALSRPETPVSFSPRVDADVRALFAPHYRYMSRILGKMERYVAEDAVLADSQRRSKAGHLAALKEFYASVAAGRVRRGLDGALARLMPLESSVLDDYESYMKADPSIGRTAVGNFVEQLREFRALMAKFYGETKSLNLRRLRN